MYRVSTAETDGRRMRSRATKAAILSAATTMFVEHGFTATSIAALATAAGVSEQTVYYSFGTKEGVLAAALDVAIAGDDEPVPTLERPWVREALDEPDPARQLRAQVDGAARILARAGPLLETLRASAPGSPELQRLWQENVRRRREVQRVFVRALARKTPLRAGVSRSAAVDTCALLLGPESYTFLVGSLGWRHERWRRWAGEALVRQLLP